jgi:hypothetical protein
VRDLLCEIGHQGSLIRDAHLRLMAERCGVALDTGTRADPIRKTADPIRKTSCRSCFVASDERCRRMTAEKSTAEVYARQVVWIDPSPAHQPTLL